MRMLNLTEHDGQVAINWSHWDKRAILLMLFEAAKLVLDQPELILSDEERAVIELSRKLKAEASAGKPAEMTVTDGNGNPIQPTIGPNGETQYLAPDGAPAHGDLDQAAEQAELVPSNYPNDPLPADVRDLAEADAAT